MRFRGVRAPVILVLHNRYRTTGGEERAVADLLSHEHASLALAQRCTHIRERQSCGQPPRTILR